MTAEKPGIIKVNMVINAIFHHVNNRPVRLVIPGISLFMIMINWDPVLAGLGEEFNPIARRQPQLLDQRLTRPVGDN